MTYFRAFNTWNYKILGSKEKNINKDKNLKKLTSFKK